jgi:Tol biopolymer transport system component
LAALALTTVPVQAQVTTRASVDLVGGDADGPSNSASISGDGRYVAFASEADNLVPNDTNGVLDVFVYDRMTGTTIRASVDSSGAQASGPSYSSVISADGTHVVFASIASDLAYPPSYLQQIYVHSLLTGKTVRVSVNANGDPANQDCASPGISADGHAVVFQSAATNLDIPDSTALTDIFVHDSTTQQTLCVSVSSQGVPANGESAHGSISGDGNLVAFESNASNLTNPDLNPSGLDLFLHNMQSKVTTALSVDPNGGGANGDSSHPHLTRDGSHCAFESYASNLVPGDTNGRVDIFMRDLQTNTNELVSVSSTGEQAQDGCFDASPSADGRYCAFFSFASNLDPPDGNGASDVFVRDRLSGSTRRVSVDSDGNEGNSGSATAELSGDGSFVCFKSKATNLVHGDNNATWDVFVHAAMALRFNGVPSNPNTVSYTMTNANSQQVGALAVVFISCTGVAPTPFPNGLTVYLTLDACTLMGLGAIGILSGYVDASGTAGTLPFTFPSVPPGLTVYSAGVTYDLTRNAFLWCTQPIAWTTQ